MSLVITFVGGGVYVPEACRLLSERLAAPSAEVRLVARHRRRLDAVVERARHLVERPSWSVRAASLEEALEGADLVILLVRVGGLAARSWDEYFPLHHGLVGDEGLGVGGVANTWRSLPVLAGIAETIARRCPDATVLNMMAPLGTTTRLLCEHELHALGVCELPVVTRQQLGPRVAEARYAGLNHLGSFWPTAEGPIPLHYVAKVFGEPARSSAKEGRADQLARLVADVAERYAEDAGAEVPELEARPTPWFDVALVPVVDALTGGPAWDGTINLVNGSLVPELPSDIVVEVEARVDAKGVHPVAPGPLPEEVARLLVPVARSEQLAYEAARRRDPTLLADAIAALPIAIDQAQAEELAELAIKAPALDVVARLGDHQSNVRRPRHAATAAVVALPMLPVCRALDEERHRRRRRAMIADLAAAEGGGDGPLPIVDLDEGGTLMEALASLADQGIERLVVFGGGDQPGWMRALGFRWPGEVTCRGDLFPTLEDDDVAPDPEGAVAPWSGMLPAEGLFGTERGQLAREQWRERWSRLGQDDAVRCAALGLDPMLEQRLAPSRAAETPSDGAPLFVVTGLDGSGKSTHAKRLCEALDDRDAVAVALKIYRRGAFLELADELGGRTAEGAPLAAFVTSRVVKLTDSLRTLRDVVLPAMQTHDALVMDRYVETHVAAAGSQLGWDLRTHPILRAFPVPALTAWLRVEPRVALERLRGRQERLTADEHLTGLMGYARAFDRLARERPDESLVLDSGAPLEDNATRIAEAVLPRVSSARRTGRGDPVVSAPQARADARRLRVVLGQGADRPVLGEDVLALRRMLADRVDDASIPESFWIEALAAQVVLDARTTLAEEAYLPVWPAALAACWPDRPVLLELGRMLRREVTVEGVDLTHRPRLFDELAVDVRAARRMAAPYLEALGRAAEEAGWRRAEVESTSKASDAAPTAAAP